VNREADEVPPLSVVTWGAPTAFWAVMETVFQQQTMLKVRPHRGKKTGGLLPVRRFA